jgi:glutamyl-tRNA synthetase
MPGLKERAKTLVELVEGARFLFEAVLPDDKARSVLTPDARSLLAGLRDELERVETWDAATAENTVRAFAERHGEKLGKVAQPLRAALTGRTTSPGIFEVLEVLGKEESLKRVAREAAIAAPSP